MKKIMKAIGRALKAVLKVSLRAMRYGAAAALVSVAAVSDAIFGRGQVDGPGCQAGTIYQDPIIRKL